MECFNELNTYYIKEDFFEKSIDKNNYPEFKLIN